MPDSPAAPAANAPDDLGADLSAAYDSVVGTDTAPAASGTAPSASPSEGTTPSSSPEGAGGDAARARGPDGKFIPKAAAPVAVDPKAAPNAQAPAEFKVPEKWPENVRTKLEEIHKVNPEHAQFLLEQYQFFRKVDADRAGQVNAKLKPLDDLLAVGRERRALQNIDDTTYVRNLIAAGEVLDKDPERGLKFLAQRYGVDLQKLANPQAAGQEPELPPGVRELQQEQQQIKQFIAKQQQEADEQRLGAAANWLQSFAAQRDENGQPRYPHFDECLPEILVNVQAQKEYGQQIDLDAAYKRAVRMNDTVWLKDQAARSESARKADEARRRQEIEEARRAGFNASGSGGASSDTPADSVRGELERLYDKKFS